MRRSLRHPTRRRQRPCLAVEKLEDRALLAAELVADINTNPAESQPSNLVSVGSTLYFTANDQGKYPMPVLWKSDGTAAGTTLVKDVRTRPDAQVTYNGFAAIGNTLYFAATTDGVSTLWKSDGTPGGTVGVANVAAGSLTAVGSTLYFTATDSAGNELWKSDGTALGTTRVKDIRPGSSGSAPWFPTPVGNQLYFVADDGSSGKELWKSDGTGAGTVRVADLNPGAAGSDPQSLTVVGNNVFFIATDGVNGYQLYKTDGTTTTTIAGIQFPAQQSSTNRTLVAAGTNVFFNLNKSELWKTDGTDAGTSQVATIPNTAAFITFTNFVSVGSTLYFTARTDAHGYELWRSDGTPAGTHLVKDLYPGSFPDLFDSPLELTRVGSSIYLISNDADLWVSDGTAAGTILVKTFDVLSSSTSARPRQLTAAGNQLFMTADDPVAGIELWRSDGSASGTRLVKDLRVGTVGSRVKPIGVANGSLLLNADNVVREVFTNGRYPTLWKSNGTTAGTQFFYEQPLINFYNDGFYGVGTVGNNFFFAASIGGGVHHLYVTNGTTTQDLKAGLKARVSAVSGSRVFIGDDELWVSDGTVAGTKQVTEIMPDVFPSTPDLLTPFGNGILFTANDGVNGFELWKSDGTAAGTVLVKDIRAGSTGSSIAALTVAGNLAYFTAWDGTQTTRPALWRTDGTAAGTFKLADMDAKNLFAMGSTLYFAGAGGTTGMELWKSDGTLAGTVLVKNISQFGDSNPGNFVKFGSEVYFTAQPSSGAAVEIWKTNGADAGTMRVSPGRWGNVVGYTPHDFVAIGNTLYFVANDGVTGIELWQTDGSANGTQLAQDIWSGLQGSEPTDLTVYQNALYFSADDGVHGRELWKIVPSAVTGLPQNPGNRFDVDSNQKVEIADAVAVIRYLRAQANGGAIPRSGPPYIDVTGDGLLSIADAVEVIKELRRQKQGSGEGEGSAESSPLAFSTTALTSAAAGETPINEAVDSILYDVTLAKRRRSAGNP